MTLTSTGGGGGAWVGRSGELALRVAGAGGLSCVTSGGATAGAFTFDSGDRTVPLDLGETKTPVK